ncbi:MAG: hypothetical protein P8N47_09135 [Bacteroidia bacterium]|jgi:hypothetical protein|nr:hypothetical protein [Bacteroidia bacterium]
MKKILSIFATILFLGSCITELTNTAEKVSNIDAVKWNPTIAVPLIYSRLNFHDLLNEVNTDEYLRIGADGSLTLVYSDAYTSQKAEDVFKINDQIFSESLTFSAVELTTLLSNGSLTLNYTQTLDFNMGASELDKLLYKQGSFDLAISTTLDHDVSFSMRIPEAMNGSTVLEPSVIANSSTIPNTGSASESLNGVEIDFTQTAQGHSEIDVEIEIVITRRGTNPIKPTETITYTAEMLKQAYTRVEGLFGSLDFSTTIVDTLTIPFFENSQSGSITLRDPRIKFFFANSSGLGIEVNVLKFDGINKENNVLPFIGFPSPLPIPKLSFMEIGQTKNDSLELNKNTSNLAPYLDNKPAKNAYRLEVNSGVNANQRQWLLDTSKLAMQVEIEIPLDGTAQDFALESSQPFELELENVSDIDEVLIRLYTENGFPLDITTQLYFEDSLTNTVLDSLLTTDILILPSATVDAQGKVLSANPKTTDISLNTASIENLQNANRIRIRATLNTLVENGIPTDVKLYSYYDLLLQLGVQAEVLIEKELTL